MSTAAVALRLTPGSRAVLAAWLALIMCGAAEARDLHAQDRGEITALSNLTVMGSLDLWKEKDFKKEPDYTTLNHEGGLNITVLEVLERGENGGRSGLWIFALTTVPAAARSGEWIPSYSRLFIFLPDDAPVLSIRN